MAYDPHTHHRRSVRVKTYDYAQAGLYFVTVCAQDRVCLFGEIDDDGVSLSTPGLMVESWWHDVSSRFPDVDLDAFVVMPNHLHGIIAIRGSSAVVNEAVDEQGRHIGLPLPDEPSFVGADRRVCPVTDQPRSPVQPPSLPKIIQWFKTMTTNDYILGVNRHDFAPFRNRLWQRNYYEHIVRNDQDLDRIRRYIEANPFRWDQDAENPAVPATPRRS